MFLYFIIIKIYLHFLFCSCLYLVVFSFWFLCYVFGLQFKFVFSSFVFIIFVLVNTPYFILFGYGKFDDCLTSKCILICHYSRRWLLVLNM
jgi:hypothetical protein